MTPTTFDTTVAQWVYVARIFHLDWMRYGDTHSRTARDVALRNARYAQPTDTRDTRARQVAAHYGREWTDCNAYERQAFADLALASKIAR